MLTKRHLDELCKLVHCYYPLLVMRDVGKVDIERVACYVDEIVLSLKNEGDQFAHMIDYFVAVACMNKVLNSLNKIHLAAGTKKIHLTTIKNHVMA